jgi:CrcB protein
MPSRSTIPAPKVPTQTGTDFVREAGWVGAGGAVGALARGVVVELVPVLGWPAIAATQAVNLAGAVALGVLVGLLEVRGPRPRWRAFLGVGVLGSFTTFSTLVDESRSIAAATSHGVALAYLAGSLGLGIAGFWLGERATRLIPPGAWRTQDEAVKAL